MRIIRTANFGEMSERAAVLIGAQVVIKPTSVLGLATGSSPVGVYENLVKWYQKGILDFSQITTLNLDEYKGLAPEHDQSYRYFMNTHLFNLVNINKDRTFVPDGLQANTSHACSLYNATVHKYGPVDVQLLGIGVNGHIGFNEPSDHFEKDTFCVPLSESTILANSRFFDREEDVPKEAYTMGIGTIMSAKRVVLIASGTVKAAALKAAVKGPITPQCPASILQLHPDCTVVADEDALALLDQ